MSTTWSTYISTLSAGLSKGAKGIVVSWGILILVVTVLSCLAASNATVGTDFLPSSEVQCVMFALVGAAAAYGWFASINGANTGWKFSLLSVVYFFFVASSAVRGIAVWTDQKFDLRLASTLVTATFAVLAFGCGVRGDDTLGAVFTAPLVMWFCYLAILSSLSPPTQSLGSLNGLGLCFGN